MKLRLRNTKVLLAAFLLAAGGYVTTIRAQTQQENQAHFTITPVTYESSVDPGATLKSKVTLSNNTDKPISLLSSIENIQRTNDTGVVELTEEKTPYDVASWVTIEPKEFILGPRASQDVAYTVQVPQDASPGGHYGAFIFSTPPTIVEGNAAAIVQQLGSLLLLRVNGDVKEDASLTSFRTKTYVGVWEEVISSDGKTKTIIAREEDKTKEIYKRYFSKGPIAFESNVHNQGNVHVKPAGYISIYNIFNKKVAELPLNAQNVFPESDRNATTIWTTERLWGVFYKAQYVGLYGLNSDKSLTQTITFWAFPHEAAIAIGVTLLLLLLLRRRLARAFRALFTGNAPQTTPIAEKKPEITEPDVKEEKKEKKK